LPIAPGKSHDEAGNALDMRSNGNLFNGISPNIPMKFRMLSASKKQAFDDIETPIPQALSNFNNTPIRTRNQIKFVENMVFNVGNLPPTSGTNALSLVSPYN
jgi:hypothetical protein